MPYCLRSTRPSPRGERRCRKSEQGKNSLYNQAIGYLRICANAKAGPTTRVQIVVSPASFPFEENWRGLFHLNQPIQAGLRPRIASRQSSFYLCFYSPSGGGASFLPPFLGSASFSKPHPSVIQNTPAFRPFFLKSVFPQFGHFSAVGSFQVTKSQFG